MLAFLSLAFGTLISEDLTCISAGLLIQRGAIDPFSAIFACAVGILVGDVGLWAMGRIFGQVALTWPWVARHLEGGEVDRLRTWLEKHAASAILGSRFLPGARLPLYVVAGVVRMPCAAFTLWAFIAALLWTPLLVLATATLGDAVVTHLSGAIGATWLPSLLVAGFGLTAARLARGFPYRTIG
jgi:membrane protein DedA with SNARE-associated domain